MAALRHVDVLDPPTRRRAVRRMVVAAATTALVLVVAAACETTPEDFAVTYDLMNDARVEHDRDPLAINVDLLDEADRWAQEMRDTCTLKHRDDLWEGTPSGSTMVAENVGVVPHVTGDPADALIWMHEAFMDSPGHRANMLDARSTHVGIGAVPGTCGVTGADSEYWVVHIFVRRS